MRCRPMMPEWVDARSILIHLPPSAAGAGRARFGRRSAPAGCGRHVRFRRVGRLYPVKAAAGIGGAAAVSRGRASAGASHGRSKEHADFVADVTIRID